MSDALARGAFRRQLSGDVHERARAMKEAIRRGAGDGSRRRINVARRRIEAAAFLGDASARMVVSGEFLRKCNAKDRRYRADWLDSWIKAALRALYRVPCEVRDPEGVLHATTPARYWPVAMYQAALLARGYSRIASLDVFLCAPSSEHEELAKGDLFSNGYGLALANLCLTSMRGMSLFEEGTMEDFLSRCERMIVPMALQGVWE